MSHGLARSAEYFFFHGAGGSGWAVRRRSYFGNPGTTLGLGKTKVWRFLQKHQDAFALHKLPGSYGCLIFNMQYPTGTTFTIPEHGDIIRILSEIRICGQNTHLTGPDNERINRLIVRYSPALSACLSEAPVELPNNGVAVLRPITRAYFSLSHCESCRKRDYNCKGIAHGVLQSTGFQIRGPCRGS